MPFIDNIYKRALLQAKINWTHFVSDGKIEQDKTLLNLMV